MSEPIKLYDADGQVVIMHSPAIVKKLVADGSLFENPPKPPAKKTVTKGRRPKKVA